MTGDRCCAYVDCSSGDTTVWTASHTAAWTLATDGQFSSQLSVDTPRVEILRLTWLKVHILYPKIETISVGRSPEFSTAFSVCLGSLTVSAHRESATEVNQCL